MKSDTFVLKFTCKEAGEDRVQLDMEVTLAGLSDTAIKAIAELSVLIDNMAMKGKEKPDFYTQEQWEQIILRTDSTYNQLKDSLNSAYSYLN